MPKKRVKYSSDPNDRMKNKDGTVKRFPNERFVGDVVDWSTWYWSSPSWSQGSVIEAIIGPDRVKLVGYPHPVYVQSTKVVRKAY
jgi:hypothetical protein